MYPRPLPGDFIFGPSISACHASIRRSRAEGITIHFREDTDVRAVLNVELIAAARALPTGTTPGYAFGDLTRAKDAANLWLVTGRHQSNAESV